MGKVIKFPENSIKSYALLAWLVAGGFAILTCVGVFIGSAVIEKKSAISAINADLITKSQTVARRVAAEMLIGPRGAVSSTVANLKKDLHLNDIEITTARPDCFADLKAQEVCTTEQSGSLMAFHKIPFVTEPYFVSVSVAAPMLSAYLKLSNMFWSAIPFAIFLAIGIFIQMFLLKRFIIRPIEMLVETTTGDKEPRHYWPKEIKQISNRLYKSFKVRDEVVFSQLTRGVIHDLKTLIHAPLGAVELVNEQSEDPEKRKSRLEHLHKVVSKQLPKMQEIIDNTLDGSREIPVKPVLHDVSAPIQGAFTTLSGLSEGSGVPIKLEIQNDLTAPIDTVQLERAITNIVKNGIEAAKAHDSSGATKGVVLSAKTIKDIIQIDIEDSGAGLPKVSSEKLFSALRSTKSHGSGLGLIVSKKIIESHGGKLIPGKSEKLGGAKFSIQLPIRNQTAQPQGEVC